MMKRISFKNWASSTAGPELSLAVDGFSQNVENMSPVQGMARESQATMTFS